MRGAIALALLFALLPGYAPAEMPIGIAVTDDASGDHAAAMALADATGFTMSVVPVFWDDMMPDGQSYAPQTDWPKIVDQVYAGLGWQVALVLPVIDTTEDRRPVPLRNLAWDDPAVTAAFRTYAEGVLSRMQTVKVLSISVGNEVDVRLAATGEWQAYARFLDQARSILNDLQPGVPVGTTLTWDGLEGPNRTTVRNLGARGDIWLITWYPLGPGFRTLPPSVVPTAIDGMVALAAGTPLALAETGFPSAGCGASATDQAAIVGAILDALTQHEGRFAYANFVWMHDLSPEATQALAAYYQSDDDCFARFLGSLGLRTRDGRDKPAFSILRSRLAR
jgi:hypothetical protein